MMGKKAQESHQMAPKANMPSSWVESQLYDRLEDSQFQRSELPKNAEFEDLVHHLAGSFGKQLYISEASNSGQEKSV